MEEGVECLADWVSKHAVMRDDLCEILEPKDRSGLAVLNKAIETGSQILQVVSTPVYVLLTEDAVIIEKEPKDGLVQMSVRNLYYRIGNHG